jgi:serine protease
MVNARVLSVTTLGLALLAAAALPGGTARAQERRQRGQEVGAVPDRASGAVRRNLLEPLEPTAEGPLLATGDLDPTAWDIPGEIIVDARDDLDARSILSLARDYGLRFFPTALEPETKEEIAEVPGSEMADVMDRLAHDPRVEGVEPLARVRAFYAPNDPLLKDQWHMERVGAGRAWDFATGRGVTVAVVDTGIACEDYGPYTKGTDLSATECVTGWNFVTGNEHANDDQGHGTHVAGTIAQSTNNGIGGAGLAFHARLMPVKVLNESGWGTTADVADGIRWAAEHGAQVINLSLGGPRNSRVLQKAIDFAVSHGVVVVAAAGNTGGRVQYPGASDGVIGVSASDPDDKIAKFSSRGEGVDLAAPGVNVTQQTICKKGREKCEVFPAYNGTSMASPHVAGAAALVVSLGVTDPVSVEDALRKGARVVDDSDAGKKLYGAGILQAANAVERVTVRHALVRLLALVALTLVVARGARKKNASAVRPFTVARLDYWLPALVAGPGLFFFAPWILPRVDFVVDLLARPLADVDLLFGASLHRFLPLANALIPFGLTALAFGVKKLRPAIAGLSVGTAAYLASVVVLADATGPFGRIPLILWCAANAAMCAWIARTNLAETN